MADDPAALVSVVVPTRNSERTLERCLQSLRDQTHPGVEIIVVDNHSQDATHEIAVAGADVVIVAGPERSRQRNVGAAGSHGAFLTFIDSDMVLEPTVLAEAVAQAGQGSTATVIPEESFGEGFWARCKALERSCYLGDPTVEAARFYSRELFEEIGGYDERIPAGPEDWDIHERARQAGAGFGRTQAMIKHDEGRLRLRETMATKMYYGRSMATYIRNHPALASRQLRVVRPAFLRHWRRLARHPLTSGGMVLMKVCELGAGAAGLAVARLRPARGGPAELDPGSS